MYFPATRVLTVLELLQARHKISGPELAARLEVDIRTVRRYITMLQDLGIPVEAERGRYGSYRLRPGFKLPPLMFTDEEALALTLGLLTARKLSLTSAVPAVEGALAKVERVLPVAVREHVRALQETLTLDFPPVTTTPATEVVSTLSAAALRCKCVNLHYLSWKGELTEREFEPYGLVCRSGYWYTAGYCRLRQELRTFRLDRVQQVELGSEDFVKPEHFDCLDFVLKAIPSTPAAWLVDVILETTLEQARHRVPAALALLEEVPEGISFRCYVDSLEWIAHLLLSLRCPLRVQQPVELREELKKVAAQLVEVAAQA